MPRFSSIFFRKNDGATIIEFAIVAPIFFLIMFGMIEFGLFMYHRTTVERIAVEISRLVSIGKTVDSVCSGTKTQLEFINCVVEDRSSALMNGDRLQVQVKTLADGGTTVPDICLADPENPSSAPETCTIYEDVDGNGVYRGSSTSNFGANGDAVEIRLSYPWAVKFPLMSDYFGSADNKGIVMISASTIIKNEP